MPCEEEEIASDATLKAKRLCIFTVKVPPGRRDLLRGDCIKKGGSALKLAPPTIRSRLIDTKIADGVAQNKLKKFQISISFGGCEGKALLTICLHIVNVLGVWAKMGQSSRLACLDKIKLQKMGSMTKPSPFVEAYRHLSISESIASLKNLRCEQNNKTAGSQERKVTMECKGHIALWRGSTTYQDEDEHDEKENEENDE